MTDVRAFDYLERMANFGFDCGDDDRIDLDRRLDRDLEREGDYRTRTPRPLNASGTVRARFAKPQTVVTDKAWRPSDGDM